MVQLKALKDYSQKVNELRFNSKMVQLKAAGDKMCSVAGQVSIPKWFN